MISIWKIYCSLELTASCSHVLSLDIDRNLNGGEVGSCNTASTVRSTGAGHLRSDVPF